MTLICPGMLRASSKTRSRPRPWTRSIKGTWTALQGVIPEDVPAEKIIAPLGAQWVPETDVKDFMVHLLDERRVAVSYQRATGKWNVGAPEEGANALSKWGTEDKPAGTLVEDVLNFKTTVVRRRDLGDGSTYIDRDATDEALAKRELIIQEWHEWLWRDPDRSSRLAEVYNEKVNRTVEYTPNGSHLEFPGMSEVWKSGIKKMRPHQRDAAWRIIQKGNTLLGHVVGSGKTATMISAGMEMKRLGLINKPVYSVLKSSVPQWRDAFFDMYPGAKILVPSKVDFEPNNRRRLFARIATGDWDAVVVSHEQLGNLPLSEERLQAGVDEVMAEIEAAYLLAKEEEGERCHRGVKAAAVDLRPEGTARKQRRPRVSVGSPHAPEHGNVGCRQQPAVQCPPANL